MLLLGIDLGTSSIKISVVNSQTKQEIASISYPDVETTIDAPHKGWAEQAPETWWENCKNGIKKLLQNNDFASKDIGSIGIAYQMHGLVMVDKNQNVLRPSIIWCDSRATEIGEKALIKIGKEKSLQKLLNFPGNFTASKLAWVKENEAEMFEKCDKIMLPGDFLAMKFTGEISISNSGLSEGIFWDFEENKLSKDILDAFGFDESIIPNIKPVFSNHGTIKTDLAAELGLSKNVSVNYKAGDQPNNAMSLNVLEPGEIAATAGTSGVVYAISDVVKYDSFSRINSFAHVNHQINNLNRIGILLCINGTGILNRWIKENFSGNKSYEEMNELASKVAIGANGLKIMPFGNGAERMLKNKNLGCTVFDLDFNMHQNAQMFRAAQEGIAFSLKYGFEMMKELGVKPAIIRAGKANMFLSSVFSESVVNCINVPLEMLDTNGAKGAALGAGVGAGVFSSLKEAFIGLKTESLIEPDNLKIKEYEDAYGNWKTRLEKLI